MINSNLRHILPIFIDIAGFLLKTAHFGIFLFDEAADFVAPKSENSWLIIYVSIFEVT